MYSNTSGVATAIVNGRMPGGKRESLCLGESTVIVSGGGKEPAPPNEPCRLGEETCRERRGETTRETGIIFHTCSDDP